MDAVKKLTVPLSYEDAASLKIGDLVYVSGGIFTARSGFYHKYIEEGQPFPLDKTHNNVMLHSGPIIKVESENQYRVQAISITTSVRFNKWEPQVIEELGLRAIIAKGRVGKETREAMRRFGCVHLSRTGTFAGAFALKVKEIKNVFWLDLGLPEALWLFDFDELGPLVVETDIHGNSVYDSVQDKFESELASFYEALGISGFEYAEK
jgi:tartrate/fumarate subfamily iron-sulfur-dependent hydro-lyase beta chain